MNNVTVEQKLDELYCGYNADKYKEECGYWKGRGYKIYRNTVGKHMVIAPEKKGGDDALSNAFGSIFGDIFGNIKG